MNEFLIELQAKLDEIKSKSHINEDISKIQSKIKALQLQAEIDPKSLNALLGQIEKATGQKIEIPGIKINQSQLGKESEHIGREMAQKMGSVITHEITDSVTKAASSIKKNTSLTDFSELFKEKISNISVDTSDLKNYQGILDDIKKSYAEFGQVKITNENFKDGILEKFKVNIEQVNGDLKETKSFIMALNNTQTEYVFNGVITGSESVVQHLDKTKNAINQTGNAINELNAKRLSAKVDTGEYDKKSAQLESVYKKLGLSSEEIVSKTNDVSIALDKLKEKNLDTLVEDEKSFANALKTSQNEAAILKTNLDSIYNPKRQQKLTADIQNWLSKNTKASKDARQSLQEYYNELSSGRVSVGRLNEIEKELKDIDIAQRELGKLGKSFIDQFKDVGNSLTQWLSIGSGIMYATSKAKEAVAELKDLDNILTEISKTSDLTKQQLEALGDSSFDSASKYGKTASDYLTGIQEMSQSGFYGDKGAAMAEQSLLAQAAGDMTAEVANNYVLATNAAYKYNGEAKKLNAVIDGQNSITNQNSVALEDMAIAMSDAGTVASSYRVSIEDLSAMIGTIESVTKSGGSEVGNGIKSILINLQNVTSDKITATLDKANASMTEFVNGTEKLRNPISILRDLAVTFNQLDENDSLRAEILTNVGGKYQASKLAALLQNMDLFDKMLVDYSEGAGSAMEEAMKSANNWEGSLNKVNNTWTKIVNNVIDSDGVIAIVNGFNSILSVVDKLTSKLDPAGTIGAGAGLFASLKNIGKCRMSMRISIQ